MNPSNAAARKPERTEKKYVMPKAIEIKTSAAIV